MKEFNVTGVCIPERNYMVDMSKKIDETVIKLIEKGKYFTINRPRQYGKTTIMYLLEKKISKEGYLVISISFEGIGKEFEEESSFVNVFIRMIRRFLKIKKYDKLVNYIDEYKEVRRIKELDEFITDLVLEANEKIVLMIDEVDKSSNNKLFLNFIGMLRDKYLNRNKGIDYTFHSVLLAGVHDIKNLKLRLKADEEKTYNSPWNIATEFDIDMSFSAKEISTMLIEYINATGVEMDIEEMSELLRDFTSGYPFLVSKLCKIIDEKLNRGFIEEGLRKAINMLLNEKNTLFDDVIKNIENNRELYNLIRAIVLEGKEIPYSISNPVIELGEMYGIFKNKNGKLRIDNIVFETLLYNHMIVAKIIESTIRYKGSRTNFIDEKNILNMEKVLEKFQIFMKSEYRDKDSNFIEREGRLLFLSFLKPIINGEGFYFVEPETRQDNRMDIVVVYNKVKYIIELKIWHGEENRKKAEKQLAGYMNSQGENRGYLVLFSFNKEKKYDVKRVELEDKEIFEVVV